MRTSFSRLDQPNCVVDMADGRGGFAVTLPNYFVYSTGPGVSPRPSEVLCCHFIKPSSSSATSGPAWGLGPRPATSFGHVINTEHINQLSRFHAQKLSVLNFVWFDQALYFFDKKLFAKNFLCQNFVCYKQIQIPRLLGGFLYDAIPLAYDY